MCARHVNRNHAILSASGAHRWLKCPPSARLEEQFEDTSSEAAKEGTLAHEIAEVKARGYYDTPNLKKSTLTRKLNKFKKEELYNPEMEGFTDDYLNYLKSVSLSFEHTPAVFLETELDLSFIVPEGFGTADCIMIHQDKLHIFDFKYGKGVPVSATQNEQLILYALGAINKFSALFKISEATLHIVQPRISNTNSWSISIDELNDKAKEIKVVADIAYKGAGEFSPGSWCRFCRARQQCRARAEENVKLAFATDKKPPLISNKEVGEYLKQGEDVAKWLSELQDYALKECLAGKDIPGFKAVEGRGSRVWANMDEAFTAIIEDGTDEAMLYERKPLSLAQVEKLMGKKHFNDVCALYINKSPGKPTLVKETDKRPAITNVVSAKEAFA